MTCRYASKHYRMDNEDTAMRGKRVYLWQLSLLTVLMGGVVGQVFALVWPEHFFAGYPLISVYFYGLGIACFCFVEKQYRRLADKRRIVMSHLLVHVVRLLVSIVVMLVACVLLSKENAVIFLVAFILNYIVYLIYDSCFFAYKKGKNEERVGKGTL